MKTKEIEYRARLSESECRAIAEKLKNKFGEPTVKRRYSFMAFGETKTGSFDIRIRITNGEAEIVYKMGAFHASDRLEIPQPIQPDQMLGLIQQVAQLTDDTKLGHRKSLAFFDKEQQIEYAVVEAAPVYYLEVEKLVSIKDDIAREQETVLASLEALGVKALDEAAFYAITTDLNTLCDEPYDGTKEQVQRIKAGIQAAS